MPAAGFESRPDTPVAPGFDGGPADGAPFEGGRSGGPFNGDPFGGGGPTLRPDLFDAPRVGPSDLFEPSQRRTLKPQRRAPWAAIVGTAATLVVVAGIVAVVVFGSNKPAPTPTPNPTVSPSEISAQADPCAGLEGTLKTHDPGGQDTPLHVVAALEYAYYVKRDTAAVTALYAPGVLNPQAVKSIEDFIKQIPVGTKYCVAASMTSPTSVNYDVNEVRPPSESTPGAPIPTTSGAPAPVTYKMTLTVTRTAPYLIQSLASRTS